MNTQGTKYVPCFLAIINTEVFLQGVEMKATQVRAIPTEQRKHCCVCGALILGFYGLHGYSIGTCSKKCEEQYHDKEFYPKQFGPKEAK